MENTDNFLGWRTARWRRSEHLKTEGNKPYFKKTYWKDSRLFQDHSCQILSHSLQRTQLWKELKTVFSDSLRPRVMRRTEMKIEGVEWTALPEEHCSIGQTLPATVVEPWFSRVVSIYILTSNLITVTAAGYFSNIGQSWGAVDGLNDADLRVSHFYSTADHKEWICPLSGCSTSACPTKLQPPL